MPPPNAEHLTPYKYFTSFIDDDIISSICYETNLYSVQNTGNSIDCKPAEIKQYIGILLYSGIVKLPRFRIYWSSETLVPIVADAMPQKRYEKIKQFIYFTDNGTADKEDKLYKVRELVDKIRDNFLKVEPELRHSVDEQMIATKGRSNIRQYMPNKPHKWGVKVFTRCGVSGFVYDFFLYTGRVMPPDNIDLGMSSNVVVKLTESLPKESIFLLYFDNFFSSINLLKYLKAHDIYCVCTFRQNRIGDAKKMIDCKSLKKQPRGSFEWCSNKDAGITIVSWRDNNLVTAASTYIGPQLDGVAQR